MKAVEQIRTDLIDQGHNVRRRLEVSDPFVRSIKRHGVLQPITVAKVGQRYVVLYGHRRLEAAILGKLFTIPAIVEGFPTELTMRQLVENIDRRQLAHMDVALALRAELDANPGLTQQALAKALGRHPTWVANKLALLRLDGETQERIRTGELRDAHRALTARPSLGDGRSAPRTEITRAVEEGRSASVVIPITTRQHKTPATVTVGVDRGEASIDVVVDDGNGRTIVLLLSAAEARLLSRRLAQAHQAIAS